MKCCSQMKSDLVQLSHTYEFDGPSIKRICKLNTRNFNLFLNDFAPFGQDLDEINKKCMTWVKYGLMVMCNHGDQQPNLGPQWWKDFRSYKDESIHTPPIDVSDRSGEHGDVPQKKGQISYR